MRRDRPRACVYVLAGIDLVKQERLLLTYAADHGLALTSVTGDHRGAVALVEAGCIDVVLVVTDTRITDEIGGRVGDHLVVVRPSPHRRHRESKSAASIQRAADHGLDAAAISTILAIPIEAVWDVLRPGRLTDRRAGAPYN
jgi:hypothetical protein